MWLNDWVSLGSMPSTKIKELTRLQICVRLVLRSVILCSDIQVKKDNDVAYLHYIHKIKTFICESTLK